MASQTPRKRPISPHLQVYKWGPHMLVSILHRVSGDALAIGGTLLLLGWLGALAGGADSYAAFLKLVWHDPDAGLFHQITNVIGKLVVVGLSWAFFQHLFSGIRHLILDTGAGYELKSNARWSRAVAGGALLATAALWAFIFGAKLS